MKEKLLEFRNKITAAPWDASTMEILFIRNNWGPTKAHIQPTQNDLDFIEFVRNNLDEIISEMK
jgi:hypothetical protein